MLPRPRLFASLRGAAAFRAAAANLPAHVEGFVVMDAHGRRVKVKGAEYLAAHADRARAAARGFFELSSLLKPGWGTGNFPDAEAVARLLPSLLEALRHEFPDAEAAVNDPRSAARPTTHPDRPNYFVCLKIDDPGVVAKVRELQSALVARDARLAAGDLSPGESACPLLARAWALLRSAAVDPCASFSSPVSPWRPRRDAASATRRRRRRARRPRRRAAAAR